MFLGGGGGFNGDGEERIRWERAINVAHYKPPVQYYNVYDIFIGGSGWASRVWSLEGRVSKLISQGVY